MHYFMHFTTLIETTRHQILEAPSIRAPTPLPPVPFPFLSGILLTTVLVVATLPPRTINAVRLQQAAKFVAAVAAVVFGIAVVLFTLHKVKQSKIQSDYRIKLAQEALTKRQSLDALIQLEQFHKACPQKPPSTATATGEVFKYFRRNKEDLVALAKATHTEKSTFIVDLKGTKSQDFFVNLTDEAYSIFFAVDLMVRFRQWERDILNVQRSIFSLPYLPSQSEEPSESIDEDRALPTTAVVILVD